jgi:UDP:flavonoid glycosyltransferase YjiC (YdhE family)
MLSVARVLREQGVEVRFSSSGEVVHFIEKQGFKCNRIPLADVRYDRDGGVSVTETVASTGMFMARTYQQLRLELSNLSRFDPDVVLSDSVLSTLLASRIARKRTITVVNQLRIEASPRRSLQHRILSAGTTEWLGTLVGLSDMVLLPDLPPPYTISESNLWNASVNNTKYIGFLTMEDEGTPDEALGSLANDSRPRIFWQVSGPPKTRLPFLRKALEFAKKLSDTYAFVVTAGDPAGGTAPKRIPGGWYYGWCTLTQHYFRGCDLVVSRAGHGTIALAISNSRPSLLVPIPRQTEQVGNARKAEKLGVALVMGQDELDLDGFRRCVERLKEKDFSLRVSEMRRIAARFEARKEIISALAAAS